MPTKNIVITDLTRFKDGNPNVCTAGVDREGTLYRPVPYLTSDQCVNLDLRPGSILQGELELINSNAPHCEDASWQELQCVGKCSSRMFRQTLLKGLYDSVTDGFGYELPVGQKCIPISATPLRSIITIDVAPSEFRIVEDGFQKEKLRATFTDASDQTHRFVSITDLGFYDHAVEIRQTLGCLERLNAFIHEQDELLLRVGLSRRHPADDGRDGYWIQVNGIYTFPDYQRHIRAYGEDGEDWEF